MFFLFRFVGFIILFVLKTLYYTLLYIYVIFILLIKSIRFLFSNKFLRLPTTLFIIGLLFSISFSILASIYFLYLMHNIALYKKIYNTIYLNINNFFNKLKYNSKIKNILKTLPPNNLVLSKLSIENDETTLNLHHLAITQGGLFNIIPLSFFLDNCNHKENKNTLIYDIFNETEKTKNLIIDIIQEDIPLTTLILSPKNDIENTINIDTFKIIEENQLPFIINSNKNVNDYLDIYNIKEILIENKIWFLDRIWLELVHFFKINKKILYFLLLSSILYYIYMFTLTLLYSTLTMIISDFFNLL